MRHVNVRTALLAGALLATLFLPARARAQEMRTFTVGAGGSLVNDTGTAANVRSFGTAGAHLFGEMRFERWGVLQVRASEFGLPGSQPGSPNLRVDAGTLTVGYFFREEWWRAGVYAGGGIYQLKPRDLEPGQIPADSKETVFGWTGALVSMFDVAPRWDLRLELAGHLIRSNADHKPIFITAGVGYHF